MLVLQFKSTVCSYIYIKALSSAIFCNIDEIAWLSSGLDVLTLYGIVDEFVLHMVFTIKSDVSISISKIT